MTVSSFCCNSILAFLVTYNILMVSASSCLIALCKTSLSSVHPLSSYHTRAVPASWRQFSSFDPMSASRAGRSRPKVVVVTGPTAVGKSNLALRICQDLAQGARGEIISVDSVQVYRGLDVGSNKPSEAERARVPHHLLDVLDADSPEAFTAGDFVRKAEEAIDDVLARGGMPVVVGGTSMYTQWLVQGRPDAPKSDPEMEQRARKMLAPFLDKKDWKGGLSLLKAHNTERAAKLHANDWYRLERALEVALTTSQKGSDPEAAVPPSPSAHSSSSFTGIRSQTLSRKYDFRCFFLIAAREDLCRLIDRRCLQMVEGGLLEETAHLLAAGTLNPSSPPGRAIGYRQTIQYLSKEGIEGEMAEATALQEFLEDFATATRRYAKQQMVWFRAQAEFIWLRWNLQDLGPVLDAVRASVAEDEVNHLARQEGEGQKALRVENIMEGKRMRKYVSRVRAELTEDRLADLVRRAQECRRQVHERQNCQLREDDSCIRTK